VENEPVICADAMAFLRFARRDPGAMDRFMKDFGFMPAASEASTRYYRGHGSQPFLVAVSEGPEDAFLGFGVTAKSRADLEKLSAHTGVPIAPFAAPGGGEHVRLTDPDGVVIDIVHGAAQVERLPLPESHLNYNTPQNKVRINRTVRTDIAPAPIFKLGHVVLSRSDTTTAARWYMKLLGLRATDILTLDDDTPGMLFMRLNRGSEPADHHSLAMVCGFGPRLLHVSFETLDLDTVGQGHRYLRERGWDHFWGIGRHKFGSQIFDYWKDSAGDEWEHYADGDVMDAEYPTGIHRFNRESVWTWGHDLPDIVRPDLTVEDLERMDAEGQLGGMPLDRAKLLLDALQERPRPWMV
jgi:catechol 2,3-dioxygenase-like lactoylglutathione lyase family enzyme